MSNWPGKFVIGLTGNIGTGKSVVRKMLEHLGAYGIDADALSHRVIAKGAPGYQPVLEHFGRWVLSPEGEIDRSRLGRMVFNDPQGMAELEKIIHPVVIQAVDMIIRRSQHKVVVIEAIKLIESGINKQCDSLWVSYAPQELQLKRLMEKRGMKELEARQAIMSQTPQEQKTGQAQVVIQNIASFEDTWRQVAAAWKKVVPVETESESPTVPRTKVSLDTLTIRRGRPQHSAEIAGLFNRLAKNGKVLSASDIMSAFGEKGFLILQAGPKLLGVMGWQVENLVVRSTDILIDPLIEAEKALPLFMHEIEQASKELQCEVSLVFTPPEIASLQQVWQELGYESIRPDTLRFPAWREAAQDAMRPGLMVLFKQLRQDRVLRPI